MRALALVGFAMMLVACPKKDDATPAPSASVSASAAPVVVDAAPKESSAWTGKYTAVESTLYVTAATRDAGLKFRGDDASVGLGEGDVSITVDPTTHAVTGELSGPLGDATIEGTRDKDDVTFTVRPKKPDNDSFYGTGDAKVDGGKLIGTLHMSRARANIIREGSFSIAPK